MEKIDKNQELNNSKSKIEKIMNYYIKENYWNLENIDISSRIVTIDIYLQMIELPEKREEYRIFIKPISWLPDLKIKNPASFLSFCNIHSFFPVINNLYIKNGQNEISINKYKEFAFVIRLFNLFFFKWYDFVLYDVIRHYLKDQEIQNIFEQNKIELPTQAEFLYLLKTLEDIKKSSFDIPKYNLHKKLWKLNNVWTYRENIFLEIWMKYENKIREKLWYENTYIKASSFENDTKRKTDFDLIYLLDNSSQRYKYSHKKIPIQFTTSPSAKKINSIEKFFSLSSYNNFLYIQVGWMFKMKISKIEKIYEDRIKNDKKRENQSPWNFPFFINSIPQSWLKEAIILYFYMHKMLSNDKYNIWKIDWINFSSVNIKSFETSKIVNWKKIKLKKQSLFLNRKNIWNMILYYK